MCNIRITPTPQGRYALTLGGTHMVAWAQDLLDSPTWADLQAADDTLACTITYIHHHTTLTGTPAALDAALQYMPLVARYDTLRADLDAARKHLAGAVAYYGYEATMAGA